MKDGWRIGWHRRYIEVCYDRKTALVRQLGDTAKPVVCRYIYDMICVIMQKDFCISMVEEVGV